MAPKGLALDLDDFDVFRAFIASQDQGGEELLASFDHIIAEYDYREAYFQNYIDVLERSHIHNVGTLRRTSVTDIRVFLLTQ